LCFDYGIELDDVTSEKEMIAAEQGSDKAEGADESVIFKIDIPANRPDLLCLEGIARALKVFTGKARRPEFNVVEPQEPLVMTVKPETGMIRPHVVCAVLRGITFDAETYQSFIDLQTKLHQNTCRRRTLVAIGTHDLDSIQGPFTYEARAPESFRFVPLQGGAREDREVDGRGLFEMLTKDKELSKYLDLVQHSPVCPVIFDSRGQVLSVPPIINGEYSKISMQTKNVFIECTATDLNRAHIVINTMCAMFGEYTTTPFEVEAVKILRADGTSFMSPYMSETSMEVGVDYVNKAIGINITADRMVEVLKKMQMPATLSGSKDSFTVQIPCTRSDVLHKCDIMEDIAIAVGFNNIERTVPPVITVGQEQPLNHLQDLLRNEMAQAGYTEILTFGLGSHLEQFEYMGIEDDGTKGVTIGNPKSADFELVRISLIPGLLKTLKSSAAVAPPFKLFECSDVVLLDSNEDVGARNERRLAIIYCGATSGFEYIHGMVDRIMLLNRIGRDGCEKPRGFLDQTYYIKPAEHPSFFPSRCAEIVLKDEGAETVIGHFGIIHPQTLNNFGLTLPVSAMEINIEYFL
jgi:phenylalanyl-tRNA synthetase beta chain